MLPSAIPWLDHNHVAYWAAAGTATIIFVGWVMTAVRTGIGPDPDGVERERHGLAAVLLLALLLAWRWPFLFYPAAFNPDEGQIVAGAQALVHDPIFWKSVDGSTAGPLNFYALLWVRLLGAPVDFWSARLTGVLLIWGALLSSYGILRIFYPRAPARLAVLPGAVFFAVVTQDDFVHYSAEHVSLLLLSLGGWLLLRRHFSGRGGRMAWWAGGAILGLLPWAKLQSIPLGAALGGWVALQVWRDPVLPPGEKRDRLRSLALAGLAPSLLFLGLIVAGGVWTSFFRSYVVQNFNYVLESHAPSNAFHGMARSLGQTWHFPVCMGTLLLGTVGANGLCPPLRLKRGALATLGFVLIVAAAVAVAVPRRPFSHYLLFLTLPLVYWTGATIGDLWQGNPGRRSRWVLVAISLAIGGGGPLLLRSLQPVPAPLDHLAEYRVHPYTEAGSILRGLAKPGDSLGIWGWMCELNVETGLFQATRGGNSYWAIMASGQRDYYRAIYMADLQRNNPALFVDAVGWGAFSFTERAAEAHEIFPALADYVRTHYSEIIDLGYARIYLRKDQAAGGLPATGQIRQLAAAGRRIRDQPPPESLPIARPQLPQNTIGGRVVRMMLPPAELSWQLEGSEREFFFDFGYDPRAYLEGQSNGTLFTAELTTPSGTVFPVYSRLLDPRGNQAERGLVRDHFPLSPFPAGSRLTLRTTAGPGNDNAWDWAYLADASVHRSPGYSHQQFPGFNRLPEAVECEVTYLTEETASPALALHAPASITYRLHGGERSVTFDFGFRAGAYRNGGRTDGAVYNVDLRVAGQPAMRLLQKPLRPLELMSDQGNQHVRIVLPDGTVAGTELVVSIDPGPAGDKAWDWTYLANLTIE